MAVAAPLVMGFLGKYVRDSNLSAASFASLIRAEGPKLQGSLPAGIGNLLSDVSTSAPSLVPSTTTAPSGASGGKPFLIVIGVLALCLISWLASRGCNSNRAQETANKMANTASQATTATNAAPSAMSALGEFFKRRLPDGAELNIPRLGIENKLIDFIDDSSKPVDKTTWFDFDRLTFNTGKAVLQASSEEQLQNIAGILKAYPKVKVKIGGYTDNTGIKQGNLTLSQDRATNVMNDLVKLGVDPSRLQAEGFGDEHPVADNTTEEGRAKNRRISLRVTEK